MKQPESLGSILFGDRIFNSKYSVRLVLFLVTNKLIICNNQIEMMRSNNTCQTLCTQNVPPEDAKFINDRIKEDYALNWLIDGLPAAEMKRDSKTGEIFFDNGFELGFDDGEYAEHPKLNNNYDIYIRCVLSSIKDVKLLREYISNSC